MPRLVLALALAASGAFLSVSAHADKGGACHFHGSAPAREETVLTCAAQRKDALVGGGKIDASWKSVRHEKIEQVDGKKGKQVLYVFLSLPGNVLAANFTGK